MAVTRRDFIYGVTTAGLGGVLHGGVAWSQPNSGVRAILPSATHDRLAVKVLLDQGPAAAPTLTINGRDLEAIKMDQDGYSWGFIQDGLKGGTSYTLRLRDHGGRDFREAWQLRTLPDLDATPERFRVLFFTCAGGDEEYIFQKVAIRRALFDRALSLSPDLMVANGDHIYWDQWTAFRYRRDPAQRDRFLRLYHRIAWIDEDLEFDSETNRRSLNTVVGRQIASIYEDRFASVPMIFVADDHDYFENDNAGKWGCTFPPRPFTFNLQQRVQAMAYPIALGRPRLPTLYESGTVETVRVGRLLEMNLYDCRRGWSFGPDAHALFPTVEEYLVSRMNNSTALQYIDVPSNPYGWTAGKLGEWYADGAVSGGFYEDDKIYWQTGWFDQHQRLLSALSNARSRKAVSISGDIHASASTTILRSGELDFSSNPIHSILPGTIGSNGHAFPSSVRGSPPWSPAALQTKEVHKLEERNGFSIVDVYPDRMEVASYRWRQPQSVAEIATLEPYARQII